MICKLKEWTDPFVDTVVERATTQEPHCDNKYLGAPRTFHEFGMSSDQAVELGKRKKDASDIEADDGDHLF